MYGITTTSWWFRPWVRIHETRIRLGKSTFGVLADSAAMHRAWLGNRRFGYFEEHYFGNVGGYRSWYVGVNDFGYDAFPVSDDWFDPADCSHTQLLPDRRETYHASTPINTIVVSGIALYEEIRDGTFFGISLGADQDLVRLADPEYHVLDSRIGRAHRRMRAWRGDRKHRRWEKRQQSRKIKWPFRRLRRGGC